MKFRLANNDDNNDHDDGYVLDVMCLLTDFYTICASTTCGQEHDLIFPVTV